MCCSHIITDKLHNCVTAGPFLKTNLCFMNNDQTQISTTEIHLEVHIGNIVNIYTCIHICEAMYFSYIYIYIFAYSPPYVSVCVYICVFTHSHSYAFFLGSYGAGSASSPPARAAVITPSSVPCSATNLQAVLKPIPGAPL